MTMQDVVTRNLLKYAVGQAIFCPQCASIMDAPRTVLLQIPGRDIIRCGSCYDRMVKALNAPVPGVVIDGREVYKTARRTRKEAK